ncbi:response regulator [Luteipulveratus halotolerans]|uniref:Transcriptional regulatory protein n=1 Tax=Luteipulveratus halotolerans TaxID=1631356 RepID=A0A0L6CMD2_9MICO|nr:response regulator [Luteipulveratus halotolerans]KNX38894.1 hypothetical protein VV01_19980 [Luteipulveratus halotolerans]
MTAVRVLVVEDEPVAARAHRTYVERVDGFEVVGTAATMADAVRLLSSTEVDLVLLDMQLPDGHGLDLLRRLRAAGHPGHVIAVTAARDVDVVRRAAAQGVLGYVIKPFTAAMLQARLRGYLDFREALSSDAALDQQTLDAAFAAMRSSRDTALPKGLSPETLQQVRELLGAGSSAWTASEVGTQVGVSRVTARRYLEHLVELGTLRRTQRSGGAGRPTVMYEPALSAG